MTGSGWIWAWLLVGAAGAGVVLWRGHRARWTGELHFRALAAADFRPLCDALAGMADGEAIALHRDQQADRSLTLVCVLHGRPVGVATIDWGGSDHPAVQAVHPDCPEIRGVEVHRRLRSSGVGSRLIAECEARVARRGYDFVGATLPIDNADAYALYLRLGYADARRIEHDAPAPPGSLLSPGDTASALQRLRFLVKPLRALRVPTENA